MLDLTPKEIQAAQELARADLYAFSRWMFLQRKGFLWQRAKHHALICNALMRVFKGECKRLVINIPPRYSKTELAVVNFIAWALGQVPDAEFIHASYSGALAINNSSQIRSLVQHEAYRGIFPKLELASEASHHWKTTAGGVMYATGTGGTITGFGAGKHRAGFGGCFPVGTRVWTEKGLLPIDRIVRERMQVRVWSFDYAGQMVLKPVQAWHENPPNQIVRVTFDDGECVECTPDHRFWTTNRGWVRADSLSIDDRLPCVRGGVRPFVSGHRKPARVEFVRHDDSTFCLTVEEHHNFTVECGLVVKNCIIIDDPHKADEARSDVIRAGVIDWFQTTLESRKNSPDTPIIVIMQRLHEKDLAGWLLGAKPGIEPGGNGEVWESLCLSVWNDDNTPLWPEKHSAEALERMERAASYVFAGQYRQRPAPPDGGLFKPDRIEIIDALPAGQAIRWVRGWDLAATEQSTKSSDPDWTAGGKLGQLADGRYVIADMARLREGPDKRDAALKTTASRDGRSVKISLPQDPGQAGKTQALALTRLLAGYSVHTSLESGDKVTRAEPLASQVNVGNVLMLRGPWNDELINEMRMFPNGAHDDQVDSLSRGFEALLGGNTGMLDFMAQAAQAAQQQQQERLNGTQ